MVDDRMPHLDGEARIEHTGPQFGAGAHAGEVLAHGAAAAIRVDDGRIECLAKNAGQGYERLWRADIDTGGALGTLSCEGDLLDGAGGAKEDCEFVRRRGRDRFAGDLGEVFRHARRLTQGPPERSHHARPEFGPEHLPPRNWIVLAHERSGGQ